MMIWMVTEQLLWVHGGVPEACSPRARWSTLVSRWIAGDSSGDRGKFELSRRELRSAASFHWRNVTSSCNLHHELGHNFVLSCF